MRVTKHVEAYVKRLVEASLPFGKPVEEFNVAKENLGDVVSEIEQKTNAYITQLCTEASAKLPEGFKIAPFAQRYTYSVCHTAPLGRAAEKHEREVRERREKAAEFILASLELGATKADLGRLISEAIS